MFLPKRAATKKFLPGVFEMPGGHIDYGEDIIAGLKREIYEEFGMTVRVGDPFAAFTYLNPIKGSHSVEIIYFATFEQPIECIKMNPEDHSDYVWINKNELNQLITDGKTANDPEFVAIKIGFKLLEGVSLCFGY